MKPTRPTQGVSRYFSNRSKQVCVVSALFSSQFWKSAAGKFKSKPELFKSVQHKVLGGKAVSTVQAYSGWYAQYLQFLQRNGWVRSVTNPVIISAFLAELMDQGKAGSTVAQAMSAVSWALSVRAGGVAKPHLLPTWVAAAARRMGRVPA